MFASKVLQSREQAMFVRHTSLSQREVGLRHEK